MSFRACEGSPIDLDLIASGIADGDSTGPFFIFSYHITTEGDLDGERTMYSVVT
jgi:hypothetical protein